MIPPIFMLCGSIIYSLSRMMLSPSLPCIKVVLKVYSISIDGAQLGTDVGTSSPYSLWQIMITMVRWFPHPTCLLFLLTHISVHHIVVAGLRWFLVTNGGLDYNLGFVLLGGCAPLYSFYLPLRYRGTQCCLPLSSSTAPVCGFGFI